MRGLPYADRWKPVPGRYNLSRVRSRHELAGVPLEVAVDGDVTSSFRRMSQNIRANPYKAQGAEYSNLEYFVTYMSNGLDFNGPAALSKGLSYEVQIENARTRASVGYPYRVRRERNHGGTYRGGHRAYKQVAKDTSYQWTVTVKAKKLLRRL